MHKNTKIKAIPKQVVNSAMEDRPERGARIVNGDPEAGLLFIEEVVLADAKEDVVIILEDVLSQRKDDPVPRIFDDHHRRQFVLRKVSKKRSAVHKNEDVSH